MNLHDDPQSFELMTQEVCRGIESARQMIIKDYYVTLFLKHLVRLQPEAIFKGGTCLSKCYKVIHRFSEDIDLSYEMGEGKLTEGMRRRFKKHVLAAAELSGLVVRNLDETRSRRDFNKYLIDYPSDKSEDSIKDNIIVETAVFQASFPTEKRLAATMLYDFLCEQNRLDSVERYGLQPFEVTVQTLERTFIDKVFAICDYYELGNVLRNSRHVYDLFKLYPLVKFDDTFAALVQRVRVLRRVSDRCTSAQPGYCVGDALRAIDRTRFYEDDYRRVTSMLLTEEVGYREAASVLSAIVRTGAF